MLGHNKGKAHLGGKFLLLILLCQQLHAQSNQAPPMVYVEAPYEVPKIEREFRGAWIATVHNIDWPSKPGLPSHIQQRELLEIFDLAKDINLNAVIFQVRPQCDALYSSELEPWSYYLTGKMGQPPQPYYDPLAFAVQEAHKRGLELHAWFNPYRALTPSFKDGKLFVAPNHIAKMRPDLVRTYGKYKWLDPGLHDVQEHSLKVIMDVVKRYDIDGVHIDDYFYPYPVWSKNNKVDFPDHSTWTKYRAAASQQGTSRSDWRRSNVNHFIESLYREIKQTKPWVKFGISPFGIWRPNVPTGIDAGIDAYDDLYADSRHWLKQGWLDYLAPQLYWNIDSPGQPFPKLYHWWLDQNTSGRYVWPGINNDAINKKRSAAESVKQIALTRENGLKRIQSASGHIHWNISSLMENKGGLIKLLRQEGFASPVLIPEFSWLNSSKPEQPFMEVVYAEDHVLVRWDKDEKGHGIWRWVLQIKWRNQSNWVSRIMLKDTKGVRIDHLNGQLPDVIALKGVDRVGRESRPTVKMLSGTVAAGH